MRISDWSSDVCSSDLLLEIGNASLLERPDEVQAIIEAGFCSPHAKASGVGQIVNVGCSGSGSVDDARILQNILQLDACEPLLADFGFARHIFLPGGIAHFLRFIECHDSLEIGAGPLETLFDTRVGFGRAILIAKRRSEAHTSELQSL